MPRILENSSASTVASTLESSMPTLGLENLCRLTKHVRFVLLSLVADGASSNTRLKSYIKYLVDEHNSSTTDDGRVLILDVVCRSHMITRVVFNVFSLKTIVAKCFCVSFLCRFAPRCNRACWALASIVEYDLKNGGHRLFFLSRCPGNVGSVV